MTTPKDVLDRARADLGYTASSHQQSPAAPPWPGKELSLTRPYMHGNNVRTWQAQMRRRGWHIDVDSVYREQSRRICLSFQREKPDWCGQADGVVGPRTWSAAWRAPVT